MRRPRYGALHCAGPQVSFLCSSSRSRRRLRVRRAKIQVYGDAAVVTGEAWSNVSMGSPYVVERGYVADRSHGSDSLAARTKELTL